MTRSTWYYCKTKKKMVEGYPPYQYERYGQAPCVIFDSMPATYHEAACRTVESRSEWNMLDRETGSLTFGSREEATPKVDAANAEKARKAELRKASKAALDAYKANPREVSQKVAKQTEQQMAAAEKAGLGNLMKDVGIKYD